MSAAGWPLTEAVISIRAVTPRLAAEHHLPAGAELAVVESWQGTEHVSCTSLDTPFGVERAARAWAAGTGAAYAGMAG